MASATEKYERLRETISGIPAARDLKSRTLNWASGTTIAVARDSAGRMEVFISGAPLVASVKTVRDILEHDSWLTDDNQVLTATRVVLPAGEHFDQVAALLCVELIDHGLSTDPQSAFAAVEPLIELALARDVVTDLTLIGLIGELALMNEMLRASAGISRRDVLLGWAGSAPSARDFQLGHVGIEVKTTQGSASIHHVEGVHQVERGHSNGNVVETDLFLLSVGVAWLSGDDHGQTLPALVDDILGQIESSKDRADLLVRIKQYGGDSALGYDHDRDRGKPRFVRPFYFRFERLYDMSDDKLKLLNSAQLVGLSNVDPGSVAFRVVLEDKIRGNINPVVGWSEIVVKVLRAAEQPPSG